VAYPRRTDHQGRQDFGVSFGAVLDSGAAIVSDAVTISLEVELVHA